MPGDLTGKHILVAEDEMFIAAELVAHLEEIGAVAVGPAGSLDRALRLADEVPLDGAVVNLSLGDANALPLAQSLNDRHIPFLFLTGYGKRALDDAYLLAPCLEKPIPAPDVMQALADLIRGD